MEIIDYLRLEFANNFRIGFDFYSYLIPKKKVIKEVMFKSYSMISESNMFFPFVRDSILFKQNFKSVLIDFLFEPTAHLAVQLHRDSHNFFTFLFVE